MLPKARLKRAASTGHTPGQLSPNSVAAEVRTLQTTSKKVKLPPRVIKDVIYFQDRLKQELEYEARSKGVGVKAAITKL
jgi:hypothetical protein